MGKNTLEDLERGLLEYKNGRGIFSRYQEGVQRRRQGINKSSRIKKMYKSLEEQLEEVDMREDCW